MNTNTMSNYLSIKKPNKSILPEKVYIWDIILKNKEAMKVETEIVPDDLK